MQQLKSTAALVAICAAVGLAAPVMAATTVSEITVTAKAPAAETASYKVSYADLDLREKAGRSELHKRIALTARYLCRKLVESDKASYNGCRDRAVSDAMPSARAAAKVAKANTGPFTPGAAWTAPH